TKPDGEVISYTYKAVTANGCRPVQSVTNNLGYEIKIESDAWGVVSKATAINLSAEYCAPTATSCSLTQTWPSFTFTPGAGGVFIGGAGTVQGLTTYYYQSGTLSRVSQISRPNRADIFISYDSIGRVQSVADAVGTWGYAYSPTGGQSPGSATVTIPEPYPLSHTLTVSIDNVCD